MSSLFVRIVRLTVFLLHMRSAAAAEDHEYISIGVSGGLQDGFPDHVKMDYHPGEPDEVQAIFIGRALVRGCKAYLDVMQEGWRQYTPEPDQPLINSVVLVSGCQEHANQYWIYAVDSRQVLTVLNNEPRFLSITPDTGLVDLTADETDETVKELAFSQIRRQEKKDLDSVAFPIVVATWYHDSFLPSPPVMQKEDGTVVTNFPDSLAAWAQVNDTDRTAGCLDIAKEECKATPDIVKAQRRYWDGIRKAVRSAERDHLSSTEWKHNGPPFQCKRPARLGVSSDMARINYAFSRDDVKSLFKEAGFHIDLKNATLTKLSP